MRADRLISLLLLLQRHPQVTVAQVAAELEISERTARRDFEALMVAGVPVYSQPGRGGGWRLVGGARTDLSGLTEAEARALAIAAGTAADRADPQSRQALRKITQALPERFRPAASVLAERTMTDQNRWGRDDVPAERPPAFEPVARAIAEQKRILFGYRMETRIADPLGMVLKTGRWYLLAETPKGRRNFRLDRMVEVSVTDEPATVPDGFDLEAAWAETMTELGRSGRHASATGRVLAPGVERSLELQFGRRYMPQEDGSFRVAAMTTERLTRDLAPFGAQIVIDGPPEVRAGLRAIGLALVRAYPDGDGGPPVTDLTDPPEMERQ